jgi:acylphosphatase
MQIVARRAYVSGRVQGVWFRGSTAARAAVLGLAGHARNLDDGRVEVLAVGEAHAVEQLLAWLNQGPPAADVHAVEVEVVEPVPAITGFARR